MRTTTSYTVGYLHTPLCFLQCYSSIESKVFGFFYTPFIPSKFYFSAALPVSVSCKCAKRQQAGGHTQPHQIRGQPARPPAITSDLRSSSPLISLILSICPTPDFPPPPFSSLHLSRCLPTPNLILSSLHPQKHTLLRFCSQSWEKYVT